jgi:Cd2+/Zn2+-exporting ATPase
LHALMEQSATFHIPALDCPEELTLIERSFKRQPGIRNVSPDYLARALRIDFDPEQINSAAIAQHLAATGFPATIKLAIVDANAGAEQKSRPLPRTMLLGGALLIAALISNTTPTIAGWLTPALAIAATIVAGVPVVASAWRALKLHSLDIQVLITIAAAGAIAIGDYFEAATAMFLFAFSLWLENLSLARANRAIRSLVALTPTIAHRVSIDAAGSQLIDDVDPRSLQLNETVLIRPGERIPIDGEVRSGESTVNEAAITGESLPVEKRTGSRLFAGSLNGEGALVANVTRAAGNTTLDNIGRLIEQARQARSPTERFVDAFSRRYTPAVIVLAVLMMTVPPVLSRLGVGWWESVAWSNWIERGLVLLVVACPCALVISTPVTIVSALYRATRHGILVKGGEFLEKAASLRQIALDKTGTITTGVLSVTNIEALNGFAADEVLSTAAALERHSEHPLARAIVRAAESRGLTIAAAESVSALRGLGVRGTIGGQEMFLGNARLFADPTLALPELGKSDSTTDGVKLSTIAWLATKEKLIGRIDLADEPRERTAAAIQELRGLGVQRVVMLTGDNAVAASAMAQQVGIDEVQAELLPQDKIERVKQLSANARTAMVGDGVNDAPALAAADIGIALGGQSSDTAMETADVVIMSPELGKVAELIRISRRCRTLLKQNIAFSLATKLAVIALAAAGFATMWMAVLADVGASLVVIANGMRMIRGGKS